MGVRFITGSYDGSAYNSTVLVDSVTEFAFGPVIQEPHYYEGLEHISLTSPEFAELFIEFLDDDPRSYSGDVLEEKWGEFLSWFERVRAPIE